METLHKLAGVQDASHAISGSPEPHPKPAETTKLDSSRQAYPEPTPILDHIQDLDAQDSNVSVSHRTSRASLSLNRRPSQKSFRSSRHRTRSHSRENGVSHAPQLAPSHRSRPSTTSQNSAGDESEEFQWGPDHPCFPHPNPHCLPSSQEYASTRVIRVKRDWLQAGDLYPQYTNLYPEVLDPLVTESEFRFLVTNLNSMCKASFDPYTARAWTDGVLSVVTGFIWDDLGLTGASRGVKSIEAWIAKWNKEREQGGREVRLVQLKTSGYMNLDFIVPDPGLGGEEAMESGIGPAE